MYDGDIWKYDELSNDYEMFEESGDLYLFQEELNITRALNDEVEIIEEDKPKTLNNIRESYGLLRIEDKKIEKLEIETQNKETGNCYITNEYGTKCYLTKHSRIIANKVNEIIDYLNKE